VQRISQLALAATDETCQREIYEEVIARGRGRHKHQDLLCMAMEGMSTSVAEIEVSHPTFVRTVNKTGQPLLNMGISVVIPIHHGRRGTIMEERRAIHHWHEVADPAEWTFEDEHGHELFRRGEGESPQEMEEAGYLEVPPRHLCGGDLVRGGACGVWGPTGVYRHIRVRQTVTS
jgi:hypothetical protein